MPSILNVISIIESTLTLRIKIRRLTEKIHRGMPRHASLCVEESIEVSRFSVLQRQARFGLQLVRG